MSIYLDKLELHGFKSFPDKTVIKLHQGITAVVGPNGCGKSNIVDSIFWVLGEQRIKNLRGENNEDLIFNGSVHQKPLGMAEVGAYFVKKEEQIYIARRFFRTGESKYILNEKYCRNRDIQDQLYEMQLGEKKYFIFEQGSIDKLISLKPSEKRLLIEEAAGILQYLERKKETAQKLIIAEQNLENLEMLSVDKEDRLRELKNQVNYVKRYRTVKDEREACLKALLRKKYDSYQSEFADKQTELEKLLTKERALAGEIGSREKELLSEEDARWKLDRKLKENQQKIYDMNRQVQVHVNESDKQQQRFGFVEQKIKETRHSISAGEKEAADIDRQLQNTEKKTADIENELAAAKSRCEDSESVLADLNDRVKEAGRVRNEVKDSFFYLHNEASRVRNRCQEMDRKMDRLENEILTKKNFVRELREQFNDEEIEESEKKLASTAEKLEIAIDKENRDRELFQKKRESVGELKEKLQDWEREIRNLKNQKEKYLQIKKKLVGTEKGDGETENFGRLQDLLQADRADHKWLENFFTDEMDALILKNPHDAVNSKQAKLYVRGKPRHSDLPAEMASEPGFVCFVADRFDVSRPDLKDALKKGVLAESLESGLAIFLKYGVSVVTPEGVCISRDGVLVRNRERGILNVIDEIREIDARCQELADGVTRLKKEVEKAETGLDTFNANLKKSRGIREELSRDQIRMKSRLEALRRNRDASVKRVGLTESQIELQEAEQEKLQGEFETVSGKLEDLELKLADIEQKRSEAEEKENRIRQEINGHEKNYIQKENQVKLLKERLRTHRNDVSRSRQNIDRIEVQNRRHTENIKSLEQEKEKAGQVIQREKSLAEKKEKEKAALEKSIRCEEEEYQQICRKLKLRTQEMEGWRKNLAETKELKNQAEIKISSVKKDLFQIQETAFQELNSELKDIAPDPDLLKKELGYLSEQSDSLSGRLTRMRESNRLNFSAESEFDLLSKEYGFLLSQKDDVVQSIHDLNSAIQKIDAESRKSFLEAFLEIKQNFIKNFKILFEGGEAEIELTSDEDVLEAGLEIRAQPPGKKLQNLRLLSGGEKTLTSLAFLFALFEYKPSPFCVFDEVDASLDEANIQRFLKFLHKLKSKTQFLIITHNFKTMEEADYIYGISMNEPGISTIYSMKMTGRDQLEPQGKVK